MTKNHQEKEELSAGLQELIGRAVKSFMNHNSQTKPRKVIVYRDGVSEGQINALLEGEIAGIQKALNQFDSGIKLVYVVLNKRVDAKFFAFGHQGAESCPEGTVIDDAVTKKGRWDFYMLSLKSRQGVANPVY